MVWTQESYHKSVKYYRPGECSPEDCLWWPWLTSRRPERKWSSESRCWLPLGLWRRKSIVETLVNVTTNSSSQHYTHPDDHTSPTDYTGSHHQGQFNFAEVLIKPLDNASNMVTVRFKDELKDLLTDIGPRVISDDNLPRLVRQLVVHINVSLSHFL